MLDWGDLIGPAAIRIGVAVRAKKPLFAALGQLAQAALALDAALVAERLAAREKLGSTGFGGGVALPHAKLPGLPRPLGLFVRTAAPVEWQAVDNLPVDCVFALLSPADAGADHLKALALVSRRLRDDGFVAKLRGAGTPDALYALFTADDPRDGGG
jgi:nitrogen PTS system EIIA component